MNVNKRTKYTSAPTYGMQKRGFAKKPELTQSFATPDFTQMSTPDYQTPPMPFPTMPFPQAYGMPPYASTIPQPPPFQSGAVLPPQPFSMPGDSFYPFMPAMQPSPYQQAPGAYPFMPQGQPMGAFPPPAAAQPSFPAFAGATIPVGSPVQTSAPFAPAGQFGEQPMPPQSMPPYVMQAPIPPVNQPPSGIPGQQPVPYPQPPPPPKAPQQPLGSNRPWTIFLLVVLPLLFVGCLFLPQAFDFLRYAFIVLCIAGLGAMFYRKMYTNGVRVLILVIYAALCITTISLLVGGSTDLLNADPSNAWNASVLQDDPAPDTVMTTPLAAPQETPPPVSPLGTSDAELRLTLFIDLWMAKGRVSEMVTLVQPSWITGKDDPTADLFRLLGNRTPLGYEIEEISGTDADNSRTVTTVINIDRNNGKTPSLFRHMILMVKEGGEWYVNPRSLVSNDELENQPVDPNATPTPTPAQMTMAPRMTETPVPAGSVELYYNPGKGSFYHADPNCKRVDSQFLPLQGTFKYEELGAYLKTLQPCLVCNAPTKALE